MDKTTIRGLRSVPLDERQRALLVQRRQELGLSQQQLADMIGCMQVSIHSVEVGKHQPRPQMLEKLCEALDLEYDVWVHVHLRLKSRETKAQKDKRGRRGNTK